MYTSGLLCKYRNTILADIDKKRNIAQKTVQKFMANTFSDEERWDIIEHYFIGKDDYIDFIIEKNNQTV